MPLQAPMVFWWVSKNCSRGASASAKTGGTQNMSHAYDAVIMHPEKAAFKHGLAVKNARAYTGPDGIYHPDECKLLEPDALGIYTVQDVETVDGKKAKAIMDSFVEDGRKPIIGPFTTREAAHIAERKVRRKTKDEELADLKY